MILSCNLPSTEAGELLTRCECCAAPDSCMQLAGWHLGWLAACEGPQEVSDPPALLLLLADGRPSAGNAASLAAGGALRARAEAPTPRGAS